VIEGLNAHDMYLHEVKLSQERQARRRDEERQRHIAAIESAKKELDGGKWWKKRGRMRPIDVRREE
jgi:hypothetical protein